MSGGLELPETRSGRRDRGNCEMEPAHAKRWGTALVALPLLILLIGKGGRLSFALLVAFAATVGLVEYYHLALSKETRALKVAGIIVSLAMIAFFFTDGLRILPLVLVLAFLGSAAICLANFHPGASAEVFYRQIAGLIYIPFLLGHLILIREWSGGVGWTFFLLAVVFAGDTGAFYVGRAIGRRKLAPSISPGKTVEGALGGLAANLFVGIIFKLYLFPEFSWDEWVILIVLLGVLGQTGDLFESMLKRSVHLKDSGTIMPGHGGLLDRIDGLIFAAPGLYYYRTYFL